MQRVAFFSPSANIWEHSFPEALVGEMLAKSDIEVIAIRCRGVLRPLCPAGQAAGFHADTPVQAQKQLCVSCNAKGKMLDHAMGFRHVEIDDYLNNDDNTLVEQLLAYAQAIRGQLKSAEDFDRFCVNGVAIGRTALYELILRHKKNDFNFSDSIWHEYLIFLRLAAKVSLSSERLLAIEKPDRVSVYNSLYVAHRAFCVVAKQKNITQYFMHAGTNLSCQHGTLMIGQDFTWRYLRDLVTRYHESVAQPATIREIIDVTQHFLCLFSSSNIFVYSAQRSPNYFDIRTHFGISPTQRLIVASTSSYDERFAVESVNASPKPSILLFPLIIDWIVYLLEIAKQRPDWFILIRVHPREFPNRRDNIKSEHSQRMKSLLQNLPVNVKVNWPDDNLSLYDLAQETDLFLNAWSSVGKEMALLGIPVVIYSPEIVLYPIEINKVGTTKEQYLQAIEKALVAGWDFEKIRQVYRWYALEFSRSSINLRVSFSPQNRYHYNYLMRAVMRVLRIFISHPQERLDLFLRKSIPSVEKIVCHLFKQGLQNSEIAQRQYQITGNLADETVAIRTSLQTLAQYLFIANPPNRPSKLQRSFMAAGILSKD